MWKTFLLKFDTDFEQFYTDVVSKKKDHVLLINFGKNLAFAFRGNAAATSLLISFDKKNDLDPIRDSLIKVGFIGHKVLHTGPKGSQFYNLFHPNFSKACLGFSKVLSPSLNIRTKRIRYKFAKLTPAYSIRATIKVKKSDKK